MIQKDKIEAVVNSYLEGSENFLVYVSVNNNNVINVYLDSDSEITIADCADVSKYIESQFDRDVEDFDLRVSSAGIDQPYRHKRQYLKNRERKVKVSLLDGGSVSGILHEVTDDHIVIEKSLSNKKQKDNNEERLITISFENIKETRGMVTFK